MERIALASEVLRAAGYDAVSHTLEVELATGRLYQYVGVPAIV
jgi:KTSC domain